MSNRHRTLVVVLTVAIESASSVRDSRPAVNEERMKKASKTAKGPGMLAEYDFRSGVRGKYADRYAQGTNVVVLDPEVAKVFPDSKSVNRALRTLVSIVKGKSKAIVSSR